MSWMDAPCRRTRIHRMGHITPDETRLGGRPQILIISLQSVGRGGHLWTMHSSLR